MRVVLAIAREQGGLASCETLPAGSWPVLLAEYRVRAQEAQEAATNARRDQRHHHRAT